MRVHGEGNRPSRVFLLGESPGFVESKVGRPFVETAPAGAELTRYLNGIALPLREDVFISNLVKEHPGGALTKTGDIKPADIERDEWELHVELDEVRPEIVVALGRHAARWLLNAEIDMEAVHGLLFEVRYCSACGARWSHLCAGAPAQTWGKTFYPCWCQVENTVRFWVLPVYHPAAGLHQPELAARTAYGLAQLSAILKQPWTEWASRAWTPSGSGSYTEYDWDDHTDPVAEQGIDTEGVPEQPWGLSLSTEPGRATVARFADLNGKAFFVPENLPGTRWIFHNYPWDARVLAAREITIDEDRFDDTLEMAYLLGVEPQGLKALALRHLGRVRKSYEETVGEWQVQFSKKTGKPLKKHKLVLKSLDEIPRQTATDYSGADADDTLSLKPILWQKVQDLGMEGIYEIDRKVLPLYSRMEAVGLPVDLGAYFAEQERVTADLAAKTEELQKAVFLHDMGTPFFNPASPDQVACLLFDRLHLHAHKKTPTGKRFSTNDKYLQALRHEHPIVQQIIDWRELAKHKNTFVDPLLNYCREVDGEIRLFFNLSPFRVVSGRVAYKQPNVGALPKWSDLGKRFRAIIRAREGRRLAEYDLSQIELRVLALDAESQSLIEAFQTGADMHGRTAAKIFGGVPEDYPSGPKRVAAKAVNFSIPMGTTKYGLAEQMRRNGYPFPELANCYATGYKNRLELEAEICDQWIKAVIADWDLTPYISEKHAEARRFGYVSDRWGRKRFLPSVLSPNKMVREEALRQAQAFGPQAGARGFMKILEARVWREFIKPLRAGGEYVEGLLDSHDALLLEYDAGLEAYVTGVVKDIFNETFHEDVPILAVGSVGQTWADL